MSATIVDLVDYGDVKGRDNYLRNTFQSVKGDGATPVEITHGMYGIPSATTTEFELVRFTASEGVVDDETGTLSIGVNDGATVNDVLALNNLASTLTTTEFTIDATDVIATGTLKVAAIAQDTLEQARIELVDDATANLAAINFVMGSTLPVTSLIITSEEVAVATGVSLTIGGIDVLDSITDGNPWESTLAVTNLKTEYTSVEINVINAYTTSLALDVNGTMRLRGNDLLFYDPVGLVHYSALAYAEGTQQNLLRSSRSGDSLVLQTSNGTSNNYLDRLTFDDGLATQSATFTNVNVGIGAAPSGTWALEVTGGASLTAGLVVGADVDMATNNLINVTSLISDDSLADVSTITLNSSATAASIDLIVGTTPVTSATFTATTADIFVPTTVASLTVTGDLQVDGTTTSLNTAEVTVEDINIELGYSAVPILKAAVEGGGITLGAAVTDYAGAIPTFAFAGGVVDVWESSIGITIAAGDLTVGTSGATTLGDDLTLLSDTAYIYIGATQQWRLGMYTDGSGDHFEISHDDLGTQTTWVTKLDVLE